MPLTSTTARQLCTKAELALFTESLSRNVKSLDKKALRSQAARARELRNKYRQLANRQDREARGKEAARRRQPSQGSAATRKKEQLFAEALARFDAQAAKMRAAEKSLAKKPAKKKRSGTKTVSRTGTGARKKAAVKKKTPSAEKAGSGSGPKKVRARKQVSSSVVSRKPGSRSKKKTSIVTGGMRKQTHRAADNRRRQARRDTR